MIYSTYSSHVSGLQTVKGSQWWQFRVFNNKDETGDLMYSPKISVQTPVNWNDICYIDPINETRDSGFERKYTWEKAYLVQGNTLEAKICSRAETEFSLPFDSYRSFTPETISEKYAVGTLIVKILPQIDAIPNSLLTITIEVGESDEVNAEFLAHTLFLRSVDGIQYMNAQVGPNNIKLQLGKWKKYQEISIRVDVRIRNRLYHPDNHSNHSIRYVPGVQIAYTEKNETVIDYTGNNVDYTIPELGILDFSAIGTYRWVTEGPSPHTTRMVWYQPISSSTDQLVEIGISKFYLKTDKDPGESVGEVYFELTPENMPSFRAPDLGYEETLFQTNNPRPGPIFIPDQPITFPITATIEAFERDSSLVEKLTTEPLTITIETFEDLVSRPFYVFNLSDIYFEVFVRPATRIRDPSVQYQELGSPQFPDFLPDDEFLQYQWYWFEIGCDKIWASYEPTNFSEIIVAIVDTGVDFTHPDLRSKILRDDQGHIIGRNTIKDDVNIMDDSPNGHGTMMAGIVAAESNNLRFFSGIAPNARIMPIKVVDKDGASRASDVAEGINFAVKHGANVISVSIGSYLTSDIVQQAIFNAATNGILVITAAGNERTTRATIPAVYWETLSVTGVRRVTDHLVFADTFSNYGPDLHSTKRSPWVSAPAVTIWSTNISRGPEKIGVASGTSYATPIVSATVALILGYAGHNDIDLSPELIWWLLQASAVDLGPKGWDPYYGHGLVNAFHAIELINSLGALTVQIENPMSDVPFIYYTQTQQQMLSSSKTIESQSMGSNAIYPQEKWQRIAKFNKNHF